MADEIGVYNLAWVTEYDDGTWVIDLNRKFDSPTWDFCWGGEAEFLSNADDNTITHIIIKMKDS